MKPMLLYQFEDSKSDAFTNHSLPFVTWFSISHDDFRWDSPIQVHDDCLEIAYIEKGLAYYSLDMTSQTVKPGEVVVINPNTLHAVSSSIDDPTTIWVIHVKDFKLEGLEENHLIANRPFALLRMKENLPFVDTLFREFKFLYEKRGREASQIIQPGVAMLMALLYDMQDDKEMMIPGVLNNFAKKLMVYLNAHYKEQLRLDDIAMEFNVSPSHLSHEFTKFFSISPINYLINRKVCEARWLLGTSEMTLEEISYSLGYDNVNHFKNIFTKRVGCSPSQYRQLYHEK